jgi:hypothetical protein
MDSGRPFFVLAAAGALLISAGCGQTPGVSMATVQPSRTASPSAAPQSEQLLEEMVTLLPRDAIRSIDNPRFYTAEEADSEYDPQELVLGVVIDGQARAYSTGLLSSHEIVNDQISGHPIAVTW